MFWRVDFSPGSVQNHPGASPQHLDAAHGATSWAPHKEILPMGKLGCFPKPLVAVCRLCFCCSEPRVHQSRSCSSVSW